MPKDLTSESFTKLLRTLSDDEEEAAFLYTKLQQRLRNFFEMKGLPEPDKTADETLDRVAEKIDQDKKIEDPTKYAFGIARLVYLEKIRREQIGQRAGEEFYSKYGEPATFDEPGEFESHRECFKSLFEHEQELLLKYFEDLPPGQISENRQKLADREGIELNALRNRVSRLRKRLEDCIGKKK